MVLTLKRKMSLEHFNSSCMHRTLQQDKKNKSRIEIHNHLLMATNFYGSFCRAVHSNMHLLASVYL